MRAFKSASSAALFLLATVVATRASAQAAPTMPKAIDGADPYSSPRADVPHTSTVAPADVPHPSTVAPEGDTSWYGGEILVPDIVSGVLLGVGLSANDGTAGGFGPTWGIGTLLYLAGGPIVHGVHGHGGKVGASIVLRLVTPIAGAAGARAVGESACPRDSDCPEGYTVLGFLGGMVVASVLDMTLVAREPVPNPGASLVRVAPNVGLVRNGAHVGLAGEF
jgi:hypothetical protein